MLLVLAVFVSYHPVWRGLPVWDDDAHLTASDLRHLSGLWKIWSDPGATQQYYPLTHTAFWLQYHLWGESPLGYHLITISLHALAAILLVLILRHLEMRWAWLAAAIWALHPLQVESVAWISELKNTLSGVLFLGAALAYLRFEGEKSWKFHLLSLGLFVAGLLAKSTVATLPMVLLLLVYWKSGSAGLRRNVLPLLPFLIVGAASGLFTAWIEQTRIIGNGWAPFYFPLADRLLVAGRAFCFYLGKIVWPAHLTFIYPRWNIDPADWRQSLFPLMAVAAIGILFLKRHAWGRAPLAAILCYVALLFPALGFFNVYTFRFSFVADHYQYLAGIGPIVLATAGLRAGFEAAARRLSLLRGALPALLGSAVLLAGLGIMTNRQCARYADEETLWRRTLEDNPACWLACNRLGLILHARGETEASIAMLKKAVAINPDDPEGHGNLGAFLFLQGLLDESITHLEKALELNPDYIEAQNNLGNALDRKGDPEAALAHYRRALEINPKYSSEHPDFKAGVDENIGEALLRGGHPREATAALAEGLRLDSGNAKARLSLGNALMEQRLLDVAITQLQQAEAEMPDSADAHNDLALALSKKGKAAEALQQYEKSVALDPESLPHQNNLAWVLLTCPEKALRNVPKALELAQRVNEQSGGNEPLFLNTLAAAYAASGHFAEAVEMASHALQLAESRGNTFLAETFRGEIILYRKNKSLDFSQ